MSWKDRYTQNLRITTGDGQVFDLYTRPSFSKDVEFHGTEFSFVEVNGDLGKKKKLKVRSFPLEFYFIGDDCLEEAKEFELASRASEAPWIIEHPYYDTILAQVYSIKFDDTEQNVSKITCVAKETITESGLLLQRSDARDVVLLKRVELEDLLTQDPNINPSINEIDSVIESCEQQYDAGVKIISIPAEAEDYFNAFNEAISEFNNFTASPILAMQAITNLLSLPGEFTANVQDRIRVLGNQIDILRRRITSLFTPAAKTLQQAQHIGLISAMCNAAVNPLEGNYTNASTSLLIANLINGRHRQFLEDMDELQGVNGGDPANFIPGFNQLNALNDLVVLTTSNLFDIALAGRKEYIYTLTEDSNVILLTHRFYGLDAADANIQELISNNSLTYKEIALGLPKGKTIKYYA